MQNTLEFKKMCHSIYDPIHGEKKISEVFNHIDNNTFNKLIIIYQNTFLDRYNEIKKYARKNKVLDISNTDFYVNSIQHFIEKDYSL